MLNDEIIRNLITANQTAIQQLGEDITKLNKCMDDRWHEMDSSMISFQRDICDRWKMISDLVKETERITSENKTEY